jgi:hypothetical protein
VFAVSRALGDLLDEELHDGAWRWCVRGRGSRALSAIVCMCVEGRPHDSLTTRLAPHALVAWCVRVRRLERLEETPLARRYFSWQRSWAESRNATAPSRAARNASSPRPRVLKPRELNNRACWPNGDNVLGYHIARAALRRRTDGPRQPLTLVNSPMMYQHCEPWAMLHAHIQPTSL